VFLSACNVVDVKSPSERDGGFGNIPRLERLRSLAIDVCHSRGNRRTLNNKKRIKKRQVLSVLSMGIQLDSKGEVPLAIGVWHSRGKRPMLDNKKGKKKDWSSIHFVDGNTARL